MKSNREIDQVNYGIERIMEIMGYVRPTKKWTIKYIPDMTETELNKLSEWDRTRFIFHTSGEYLLIYDEEGYLLYVSNETGNSTLWTLRNLMDIIGNKF